MPSRDAKIIDNITIASGETHSYTITLTFLNKNENQNDNMNKSFEGKLQVYDTHNEPDIAQPLNTYLRSLTSNNTTVVQDDTTDDHNMRYIGAEPDNYVYFNCSTTNPSEMNDTTCETWRVIGVFNNGSYSGTNDNLVKIVRNEYINNGRGLSWNYNSSGRGTNNWNAASLQMFLNANDGYYGGGTSYIYYNGSKTSTNLDISSYSMKSNQRNMIAIVNWKTGAQPNGSDQYIPSIFYTNERGITAAAVSGATIEWENGKIGLPYISDYAYATSGGSIGISTCLSTTMYLSNNTNWRTDSSANNNCATNSWLINIVNNYSVSNCWSLVGSNTSSVGVFDIRYFSSNGPAMSSDLGNRSGVLPTLYLNNDVSCTNCDEANAGSSSNPFKLTM